MAIFYIALDLSVVYQTHIFMISCECHYLCMNIVMQALRRIPTRDPTEKRMTFGRLDLPSPRTTPFVTAFYQLKEKLAASGMYSAKIANRNNQFINPATQRALT